MILVIAHAIREYLNLEITDSLAYLVTKIWELVPNEMKNLESLTAFKTPIKNWKTTNCPCRLCKNYISQVGFVYVA